MADQSVPTLDQAIRLIAAMSRQISVLESRVKTLEQRMSPGAADAAKGKKLSREAYLAQRKELAANARRFRWGNHGKGKASPKNSLNRTPKNGGKKKPGGKKYRRKRP